jgi:predicted  nucleic acid-binding Zn-ribbon protein
MSDSQAYDPVTVSSDGVTVAKRFEEDEFPVPAIAFRIESSRSETVSVRLVDVVPDDVAVEDLGFHPEYGSEYWTIDDQKITFERDIEAESEYTTVYGIRSTGTDNVEQFLTRPTIEMVDPPLEDDEGDVLDESGSDVVKDVIAGESDSVPGLDDDEDEEIETLNLKDPNDPTSEAGGAADADGAEGDAAAQNGAGSVNVTRAMVAEIQRGDVDDEVLSALQQVLGGGGTSDGATDARIQHLQNEISDIAAYTEALEEFLAENGTGEQVIEDFRNQLNSFQSELDDIQSMAVKNREAVESVQSTVDSVDGRIGDVEGTVGSLDNEVGSLRDSVSTVEDEVGSLDETVGEIEGEVQSLDETVDSVEGRVDSVEQQVGDVDGIEESLQSLEEQMDDLRAEMDSVSSQVSEVDVESEIEEIESEIEELKQWREQLSSVIGGGGD